jgi:O-methyltransferase involved in polyketide biosynthesis
LLEGVSGTGLAVAAIRAEETARPDRLFADPLAAAFVAAAGWPPGPYAGPPSTQPPPAGRSRASAQQAGYPGRVPVPCDLRADWPAALLAAGLRPGQPTTWLAEGLLVYLAPADVDQILTALTRLSAPASRLGLTYAMARPADSGRDLTGRARIGRTRIGRTRTSRRSSAPADPVGWLAGHGWPAQVTTAREVLTAHGRPAGPASPAPSGPPRGLLVSAVRDPASRPKPATSGLSRSGGRCRAIPSYPVVPIAAASPTAASTTAGRAGPGG